MITRYDEGQPAEYQPFEAYSRKRLATVIGFYPESPLTRIWGVLTRRLSVVMVTLAVGLVLSVVLLLIIPKTYQGTARVMSVAAGNGRDPADTSIDLPSLATSSVVLSRVTERLGLPIDIVALKRGIRTIVKNRSSIMEIGYRDRHPERAVAIPNAVADELVSYYDSISGSGSDLTINKLDAAIVAVQQRLRTIDDAAAAQARAHPFVQSDKSLDDATAKLDDLTSQSRLMHATLDNDIAARAAVAADTPTQTNAARYEKLQNDPTYRELSEGLAKDEAELASDKALYTDANPQLRVLQEKVDAERLMRRSYEQRTLSSPNAFSNSETVASLDARKADAIVAGDRAKLAAIDALLVNAKSRLHDTLDTGVSVDRLKLQRDAAKADYLALTARRAAAVASRAEALSLGSVMVVDRAVRADTTVVGLGRAKMGALLAFLSLVLAITAAFVAEALDKRLSRTDQIEAFYGVPLVAVIDVEA